MWMKCSWSHICLPSRGSRFDSGHPHVVNMDEGPREVLRALQGNDPDELTRALKLQRKTFKDRFGCYPEELEWEGEDVPNT